MQDCIKELPQNKKSNGKTRTFEVSCPNYGIRERLPKGDYCKSCKKSKPPKTSFVFAGIPPYKPIESDAFRCGRKSVFGFDAKGNGNPYFTWNDTASKTITPEREKPDLYF